MIDPLRLPTRDGEDAVVAIIETPRGSPNKMKWDQRLGAFRLAKVLPTGMVLPFDFGFIPGTRAADGDPLDIVVLPGAPVCTGSVVPCRQVAVLEAGQQEADATDWVRNERRRCTEGRVRVPGQGSVLSAQPALRPGRMVAPRAGTLLGGTRPPRASRAATLTPNARAAGR